MSEDFGNDFITLTDEEGNDAEFEHLDTMTVDGETYMAFVPAGAPLEDDAELIILKLVADEQTGEELLASLEDEDEADRLFGMFKERMENYYEAEDENDEE